MPWRTRHRCQGGRAGRKEATPGAYTLVKGCLGC